MRVASFPAAARHCRDRGMGVGGYWTPQQSIAASLRRPRGVVVSDPHLMRALAGEWELAGQRVCVVLTAGLTTAGRWTMLAGPQLAPR